MPPALFSLVILKIRSCFFAQASPDWILLFNASQCRLDGRRTPPHLACSGWDGVLQTFLCLSWPLNHDPPNLSLPSS
jgi:hypothetical protein